MNDNDPVTALEAEALSLAKQIGFVMAQLPHTSLVVTRQVVADAMVATFVEARVNDHLKVN